MCGKLFKFVYLFFQVIENGYSCSFDEDVGEAIYLVCYVGVYGVGEFYGGISAWINNIINIFEII